MRRTFVVIAVAACDAPAPTQPDAAVDAKPPLVLETIPMNIVVTQRSIEVYMEALDLGERDCKVTTFPTIGGACSWSADGNPCWGHDASASCITNIALELDGKSVLPANRGGIDPWTFYDERFDDGTLTLIVAGCGHPATRIPLGSPSPMQAGVTAVQENRDVHVTWTTDPPASSAIVGVSGTLFSQACHTVGINEQTISNMPNARLANVIGVDTRTDLVTDFGPATIWRGVEATTSLQ